MKGLFIYVCVVLEILTSSFRLGFGLVVDFCCINVVIVRGLFSG